jgi:hypothetical protein
MKFDVLTVRFSLLMPRLILPVGLLDNVVLLFFFLFVICLIIQLRISKLSSSSDSSLYSMLSYDWIELTLLRSSRAIAKCFLENTLLLTLTKLFKAETSV